MSEDNTTTNNKLSSRKFIVWLVWLVLTLIVGVYAFMKSATDLFERSLSSFFAISMMYLGMNVGQKVGFAVSDALVKNKSYSKEDDDE